jgi:hypothetical protein
MQAASLHQPCQPNPVGSNKSGFDKQGRSRFFFLINNACQLEGSDHGGRDSAAELALAGTIDVQVRTALATG